MQLYERFRPKTLDGVIGQPKVVEAVRGLMSRGVGGRSILFEGPSASGKTTLARIVAAEIADDFFVSECVADDLTPDRLADWERTMHLTAWGKGGRAFIVNEIHGAKAGIQRRLDQLLEGGVPSHCVFLATTTWDGQESLLDGIDGAPFLSRFLRFRLTNQGLAKAFAPVLMRGARELGLDGQPEEAYVRLMQRVKNNARAAWQEIESGAMLTAGGGA